MLSLRVSSTESLHAQSAANLAPSLDPAQLSSLSPAVSAGSDTSMSFSKKCEEGLANHTPTGLPHSTGFQHLLQGSSTFQSSLASSVITASTAVAELDQENAHVKPAPIVPLSNTVTSSIAVGSSINDTSSNIVLESGAVQLSGTVQLSGSFVSCPLMSYPTTPLSDTPPSSRPNSPLTSSTTPNHQFISSPTPPASPFTPCSLSPSPSPVTPPDMPASPEPQDQTGTDVSGASLRSDIINVPLGEDKDGLCNLEDNTVTLCSEVKSNGEDCNQEDDQSSLLSKQNFDSIRLLSRDVDENINLVIDQFTSMEHVKVLLKEKKIQPPKDGFNEGAKDLSPIKDVDSVRWVHDEGKHCGSSEYISGILEVEISELSLSDQQSGEKVNYQLPHVSDVTKKCIGTEARKQENNTLSVKTDQLIISPENSCSSFETWVETLDTNTSVGDTEKLTIIERNSDVSHLSLTESEVEKHDNVDNSLSVSKVEQRTIVCVGNQIDIPPLSEVASPGNTSSRVVSDNDSVVELEQPKVKLVLPVGLNDENETEEKNMSCDLMASEGKKINVSINLENDSRSGPNERGELKNSPGRITTPDTIKKDCPLPLTELICASTQYSYSDCGALHEEEESPELSHNSPLSGEDLVNAEKLKLDLVDDIQKSSQDSSSSAYSKSHSNCGDSVGLILPSNTWPVLAPCNFGINASSQESLEPPARVQLKPFTSDDIVGSEEFPNPKSPADNSLESSTNRTKVTSIIVPSHLKSEPSNTSVSSSDTVTPNSDDLVFISTCPLDLISTLYDRNDASRNKNRTHIEAPAFPTSPTITDLGRDSWDTMESTPMDVNLSDSKSSQSMFDSELDSNAELKPQCGNTQMGPSATSSNLSASEPTNSTLTTVSELSNNVGSPTSIGKFMGVPLVMDSLLLHCDSEQVSGSMGGSPNVILPLDEADCLSFQSLSQGEQQNISGLSQSPMSPWEGLEFSYGAQVLETCVDSLTKEGESFPQADDLVCKELKTVSRGEDESCVDVAHIDELLEVSGLTSLGTGDMVATGFMLPRDLNNCLAKVNLQVSDQNVSASTTVKNVSLSSLDSTIECCNMSNTSAANASHFSDVSSDVESSELNENTSAPTEFVQSESGQSAAVRRVVSGDNADSLRKTSKISLADNLSNPSFKSWMESDVPSKPTEDLVEESIFKEPPSCSHSSKTEDKSQCEVDISPVTPSESSERIMIKFGDNTSSQSNMHGMNISSGDSSFSMKKFEGDIGSKSTLRKGDQIPGVCIAR